MIAGKILKLVLPKIVDHIVKSFKLHKIEKLIDYMEKPNDADKKIEELTKENIIMESKIKSMRNDMNELKLDFQKWKKNA